MYIIIINHYYLIVQLVQSQKQCINSINLGISKLAKWEINKS